MASSDSTALRSGETVVLLGTKRGLFTVRSRDRVNWECAPTTLAGTRVYNAALDQRGGRRRIYAADNGDFFGTFLRYSDDFGQTWQEPEQGIQFPEESGLSLAHGEIVALLRAQNLAHELERASATPPLTGPLTLVTSTEPCCQCFGAIVWSGVDRLVCGATTADAESIGFDEGPKPEFWPDVLEQRGITVELNVRRNEARAVLEEYRRRGGPIYGLRHPSIA